MMAGCLSQRYQEELSDGLSNEVDIFTGVGDYDVIDKLVEEKRGQFTDKVFLASEDNDRVVTGSSYHAYVKISEGCNQKCSFCAIPSFKGKLNSRPLGSIEAEVKELVRQGYYDFSFVSQDSSSYLRDINMKDGLEQLISRVENIYGVKSARILYLYPSTTSNQLIEKIANSKIFHSYYDMPLQHISSSVLKIMKRGKGAEQLKDLMQHMKDQKDSFTRTTFIAGHPGETEENFNELCEYLKEYRFDRANVFSYSDEDGTGAYDFEDKVPQELIDERAEILGDIISQITQEKLEEEVGKTFDIVVDGESSEHEYLLSARKLSWAPDIDGEIYVNDNELDVEIEYGVIYEAKITDISGDKLIATILKKR